MVVAVPPGKENQSVKQVNDRCDASAVGKKAPAVDRRDPGQKRGLSAPAQHPAEPGVAGAKRQRLDYDSDSESDSELISSIASSLPAQRSPHAGLEHAAEVADRLALFCMNVVGVVSAVALGTFWAAGGAL